MAARKMSNGKRVSKVENGKVESNGGSLGDVGSLRAEVELITPEAAAYYLENKHRNRKVNSKRVDYYVEEMRSGRWRLTGEAIKFNEHDQLIDGQTRLTAVVQSGIACPFLVVWGCGEGVIEVLDSGQARSVAQTLQIKGKGASKSQAAILRAMYTNLDRFEPQDISRHTLIEGWDIYGHSVVFASSTHGRKPVLAAGLRSVIARAHYCEEDVERLARFIYILDTGFAEENTDNPAVALRNLYLSSGRKIEDRVRLYTRTITALRLFLSYSNSKVLRAATKQAWIIPEIDTNLVEAKDKDKAKSKD